MHRILCDNIIQSTKAAYSHFETNKRRAKIMVWGVVGFVWFSVCCFGFFLYNLLQNEL